MKKTMMTLAAVLCCALSFTACNKDNTTGGGTTPSGDDPSDANKIAKVVVEYLFQTTDAMLQYFDFNLEYLNASTGAKESQKISTAEFTKEYSDVKLPLSMGFNLTSTLKDGKTLEELKTVEKMDYILPSPSAWISMYNKDGKLIGEGGRRVVISGPMSASGERVAQRFEEGSFNKSYLENVDAEGNGTSGEWK